MPYKFKPALTVPENVKRIASEEMRSAIEHLRGKAGVSREESVHEVRKSIKKTRALLRLVRPELGQFFAEENGDLRDTGHRLSELRDAGALIAVLDNLSKQTSSATARRSVSAIRRSLTRQKERLEKEAASRKLMPSLAGALVRARRSVRYWPLETDGFAAVEAGLQKTFRDGRKALAQARKTGLREDFHEWRKRVKDHWYHLRLLAPVCGPSVRGQAKEADRLAELLGDEHDLAVLKAAVEDIGHELPIDLVALLALIDHRRQQLHTEAIPIGERLYAEKPKAFRRRMRGSWRAGRALARASRDAHRPLRAGSYAGSTSHAHS
jgi:CHAD domain-containing protein